MIKCFCNEKGYITTDETEKSNYALASLEELEFYNSMHEPILGIVELKNGVFGYVEYKNEIGDIVGEWRSV